MMFICNDINDSIFIIKVNSIDLTNGVFFTYIKLLLPLDVDQETVILVGNDEDALQLCACKKLRLCFKGFLVFVDFFYFFCVKVHLEYLFCVGKDKFMSFDACLVFEMEVH